MPSIENRSDEARKRRSDEGSSCGNPSDAASLGRSVALPSQQYWRSIEQLDETPEFRDFMHREFPSGASELLDADDRRHFLKIMGASMALAGVGLAGCRRWPEEAIVPFARRPEGRMPGVPVQYATMMEVAGVAAGLLATSYDGRPIKIEGNPLHPINGNVAHLPEDLSDAERMKLQHGGTMAHEQASVLNLYDPDRSRFVRRNGEPSTWSEFAEWARDHFGTLEGPRSSTLAVLCEATSSPSVLAMKRAMQERFPRMEWITYEPLHNDEERRGAEMAFGEPLRAHWRFDQAKAIVSLDADFLLQHPAAVKHNRDFARGRRAENANKSMSRLYVCESTFSMTGANADHRFPMRRSDVPVVAARLAQRIVNDLPNDARQALAAFDDADVDTPFIDQIAEDLLASRGEAIVVVGQHQPAEVHLLAHLVNEALDAAGNTVTYTPLPDEEGNHLESIRSLAQRIEQGEIETLLIIGGNPAYNAPADLDFAAKLDEMREFGEIIHLSENYDETSRRATWHVNRAHYLETWSDARAWDGTICVGQPLILPLFEGKSPIELLAVIVDDDVTEGQEIVQRTFREMVGDDAERRWRRILHDGVFAGTAFAQSRANVNRGEVAAHMRALRGRRGGGAASGANSLEIVFIPDHKILDGRFANNGWLQELPEVMTRLTWDNALLINPSTGKDLGVKTGDMVRIEAGDRSLDVAIMLLPGHPKETGTLALGYGRDLEGRISYEAGFNAYALRTTDSPGFTRATVSRVGRTYELATVQDHHAIDTVGGQGAQQRIPSIYREATRDEYEQKGSRPFRYPPGLHVVHRLSQWDERYPFHRQTGYKGAAYAWAMSIDLSACTGCGACVVACQAENNIPIVGKDQVRRQREMHWIRVDRYFRGGTEEQPEAIALQPVPCMHCENAPCEQVCPVAATLHDHDGLNVMVYNRCIGTRYCSNNCPYKVRRFNYFDYHRRRPARETGLMHVERDYYTTPQAASHPLKQLQFNPEVTVRSRGIMEKCTYCTQRIAQARIKARNEWRKEASNRPDNRTSDGSELNPRFPIEDGSFTTACAQACPAQAIVFGDLLDESSRVHQLHKHDRSYEMLEELNVKPRTKYLGKLRNPREGIKASRDQGNKGS